MKLLDSANVTMDSVTASITHPVTVLACWRRQGCIDLPSWPAGCVCNKGSSNGQNEESQTGSYGPA